VATNRLTEIAEKVIILSQTTFILGQNIMEAAVLLHETIHEVHHKKDE
jgi:hypothetical protein